MIWYEQHIQYASAAFVSHLTHSHSSNSTRELASLNSNSSSQELDRFETLSSSTATSLGGISGEQGPEGCTFSNNLIAEVEVTELENMRQQDESKEANIYRAAKQEMASTEGDVEVLMTDLQALVCISPCTVSRY